MGGGGQRAHEKSLGHSKLLQRDLLVICVCLLFLRINSTKIAFRTTTATATTNWNQLQFLIGALNPIFQRKLFVCHRSSALCAFQDMILRWFHSAKQMKWPEVDEFWKSSAERRINGINSLAWLQCVAIDCNKFHCQFFSRKYRKILLGRQSMGLTRAHDKQKINTDQSHVKY